MNNATNNVRKAKSMANMNKISEEIEVFNDDHDDASPSSSNNPSPQAANNNHSLYDEISSEVLRGQQQKSYAKSMNNINLIDNNVADDNAKRKLKRKTSNINIAAFKTIFQPSSVNIAEEKKTDSAESEDRKDREKREKKEKKRRRKEEKARRDVPSSVDSTPMAETAPQIFAASKKTRPQSLDVEELKRSAEGRQSHKRRQRGHRDEVDGNKKKSNS